MINPENSGMGSSPLSNIPMGTAPMSNMPMEPQGSMGLAKQGAEPQAMMKDLNAHVADYRAQYPEVYYKVKPFVSAACDQMDADGAAMPTQQQIESMTDSIYDDVRRTYPDLADYMSRDDSVGSSAYSDPPAVAAQVPLRGGMGMGMGRGFGFGRPFMRRGMGRDFITLLLLSELFGRRRRRYPQPYPYPYPYYPYPYYPYYPYNY